MKELIWQNVTEGPMTKDLKNADIAFLSEASLWRTRRGRRRCRTVRNRRLKGLVISVKRSEFKVLASGSRIFHLSGKAEGWEGIHTPARGVLWIIGYWRDDPEKKLYCYWVTHFLNSWNPAGRHDRWTADRYRIVTKRSIPVVEDLVADKMRNLWPKKTFGNRYLTGGLGGGDTNSLPWDGDLEGMKPVYNKGLDRVWKFGEVDAQFVGDTPKTGVGNQSRHHGKKVKQDTRTRKVSP